MSRIFIFGILNITEDSFSDGGKFLAPEAALAQAEKLIADGADALDLGAASSNPRSKGIAPELEIARLKPVIARAKKKGWKVSVDSFARETQAWAIENDADYINDIQGFPAAGFLDRLDIVACIEKQSGESVAADLMNREVGNASPVRRRLQCFVYA